MTAPNDHTLYEMILGENWVLLPPQLRAMHDVSSTLTAMGSADVERGGNVVARMLATVGGLPNAGRDVPLEVRMSATATGETWVRSFGRRDFASHQAIARSGKGRPILEERVGPVTLSFQLTFDGTRLNLTPHAWSLLGLPLPRRFFPITTAFERVNGDGRFSFFVEAALPLVGLIVRYTGWLEPVTHGEMDKISRS